MRGIVDVDVAGLSSAMRGLAVRTDGSIESLTTSFAVSGVYDAVSVSTNAAMALSRDGVVTRWLWSTSELEWSAPLVIPGSYQDCAIPSVGGTSSTMYAVCSTDTDRNGEDDLAQVVRGEIPDVNGDIIDDRLQSSSLLWDRDANGIVDAAEIPAIAGMLERSSYLWYGSPSDLRVAFLFLDRVPVHAEAIRRVPLRHADTSDAFHGVPAEGLLVNYCIWLDPNGDGQPDDAVEIWRKQVLLEPDGSTDIEVEGISVGPPGTVFFHGLVYDQHAGRRPALTCAQGVPAAPADPMLASRTRGRCWFAGAYLNAASSLDFGSVVRSSRPLEMWGHFGQVHRMPLLWGDRAPADCDQDGTLDSTVLANQPFYIADPDLDRNGVIDACEHDCDSDGFFDFQEIAGGAADCDLNLLPDECKEFAVSLEETLPVPEPGETLEFAFGDPPAALTEVVVTIDAIADLGAGTELLLYSFEGEPNVVIFGTTGNDCPSVPDRVSFSYSAAQFDRARADGTVSVRLGTSSLVDPTQCADGFLRVEIAYIATDSDFESDCDENSIPDPCQHGIEDCDGNGIPDSCEVADPANDGNGNGVLDACELDCDRNGELDAIELAVNPNLDCDGSGYLDSCEFTDCDANGVHDRCQILSGGGDCNGDGILDACQELSDCDGDGIPSACESDCDANGIADDCDLAGGAVDKDADDTLDACEYARGDFDLDGLIGAPDLAYLLSVWGAVGAPVGDLSGDGSINAADLSILLANWGPLS